MAPRKRKGASESEASDATFKRVTRSQTRGDTKEKVVEVKAEKAKKKNTVKAKTTKSQQQGEDSGKPQVDEAADADVDEDADADVDEDGGVHKVQSVVVEHCTQCTQFKKRAIMVKEGLINAVPGVTVLLNPVKPRRGCFEIREEGGEIFLSLQNMKRPFEPMKKLVMEDVIESIIDKIKS